MTGLSLRLPDKLLEQLEHEARLSKQPRSEVARRALAEWLKQQQDQRRLGEMARAAREIYADPEGRAEARKIQRELDSADDSLDQIEAQERAAGVDPEEKWWD